MDRKSNKEIIIELKKFIKLVNKQFKLENAILFGSRAREDHLNSSDVDLILVSNDFKNISFKKRGIEFIDLWNEPIDIQILCYTQEEFNKLKKQLGIVSQAIKEGIILN